MQPQDMAELSQIYGAWNPEAYLQGRRNVDLSNQYQEQGLHSGALKNEAAGLDNMFQRQNDPIKLRKGQLDITGQEQTNEIGALGLERARANQKSLLSADQRKAALSASEDEIKQLDHNVGLLLRSKDPQEREEGLKLQQYMPEILAERRKQADTMEKERYTQTQQTGRTLEQIQSNERIAATNAASRAASGGGGAKAPVSITTILAKLPPANRLGPVKAILDSGESPERPGQPLSEVERTYFTALYEQDVRTKDADKAAQGQGIAPTVEGGRVVLQPKVAPTVGGGATAPKPAEHGLADVQKMYPGIPAEKLKEVYKKKFGVDLK